MNIETLKTFIALAELKNFTRTALKRNVVQSTITIRIKELEDELGVKLFDRNNRSVVLTDQGSRFVEYANKIIECENQAKKDLLSEYVFKDHLRLGLSHSLYSSFFQDLIMRFLASNKNISINVKLSDSIQTIWNLEDDSVDLSFCFSPYNNLHVVCLPYQQENLVMVTSHKNRAQGMEKSLNDLQNLPLILTAYTIEKAPKWYLSIFEDYKNYCLKINSGQMLIYYLKNGFYYSILPYSLVRESLEEGSLIEIKLNDVTMPVIRSYLIYKERSLEKPFIKNFVDFCMGERDNHSNQKNK